MPKMSTQPNRIYSIHMYKQDLILNNLQRFIFQETKLNLIINI